MRVAIVFPRLEHQLHGLWSPLGIIYLGTILRERGHEVGLFDSSFDKDLTPTFEALKEFQPELVGISALSDFFDSAQATARFAKEQGWTVVMGGAHATMLPKETLLMLPEVDYIGRGEGEELFTELLNALENDGDLSQIAGIGYRDEAGQPVLTPGRAFIGDLENYPIPDRDMLPTMPKYVRGNMINLHAARGCPFKCAFCQPTLKEMFGKKMKYRKAELMAEEVELLHDKYGVTDYFFVDDIFTINNRWLGEMVDAFNSRGLPEYARFAVNSRVDTLDRDAARLCKEMGVFYMLFGIESGSQEILDSLKKGTTIDQGRQAFAYCREFGLRTHAYILLGSPMETKESLRLTEEFVEELDPYTIHVSIFTPLPGTDLRDFVEGEGRLNWEGTDDLDYYTVRTKTGQLPVANDNVTYDDVLDCRERILRRRKRRVHTTIAKDLLRDMWRERNLGKLIFAMQFRGRMNHYFG